MNAFTYFAPGEQMMEVVNGRVGASFTKNEFREGLEWLNMLVREGLLDPLTFTQDEASLRTIMNQETMIVGAFSQGTRTGVLDTNQQRSRSLVGQPPLTGPRGVRWSVETPPAVQTTWQITRASRYPAVAFRHVDYQMNHDITFIARFGFEGQDWERVNDPRLRGLTGEAATWRMLRNVWQMPNQNVHWQWPNSGFMRYGTMEGQAVEDPLSHDAHNIQIGMAGRGLQPREVLPVNLVMNAQEAEVYALLMPTIRAYVHENMSRFVVGDRPFTEWNAYLADLNRMGLPRMVATFQSVYDRMMR
jgi:putative aldouronate transport system substrate-binding protein